MALWRSAGKDPERATETKDAATRRHSAGPNYQFSGVPYAPPLGELDLDRAVDHAWGRVIWVYRAIDARAKNASRLTVRVNNGRGIGATEIENHPLSVLLNRQANPYETGQAFRYRLHTQMDLSKRGVFVEVVTGRGGALKEMHLLNPKHTWPIPDPDRFVSGFQMRLPSGETFDLPVFKEGKGGVLWIRRPHPTDPYSSSTWLDAAGISIDLDHYARVYNRNFLYNDGRPGGILVINQDSDISPEDAAVLQARMSGGPGSAGRVTIMEADQAEYHDTSTTARDAQYVESRALSKGEILGAAGTPESLWNASGRTFDNADAELESWWRNEMVPECEAVASFWEQLTPGGIANDDEVVTYAWEDISVLSRDEKQLEDRLAVEFLNGTITLDEYRTGTGKLPMDLPGSRVAWLTAGKAPVGSEEDVAAIMGQGQPPADGQTPPPDSEPPSGPDGGGDTPPDGGAPTEPPTDAAAVDNPSEDPLGDLLLGATETKALTQGKDTHAQQRQVQSDLIGKWETALADEIATLIRRQENVVMARLTGAKARKHTRHWVPKDGAEQLARELKKLDAEYVIDRRRWIDEVVAAIGDMIRAAFGAAGTFMLGNLDPEQEFDPTDAADEIVAKTVRVIAEGFDARAGRLQQIVTDGDKAGKTIEQIADDVKGAFTAADTWASVSSRQVVGAMNAAQNIAATQAGAVKKRWLATDDERTRTTHREAEGQVVDMDEKFDVGEGELMFPGDPTGPIGEWINCLVDPDAPILTSRGWRPVQSIRPGDTVFTHKGNWRKVTRLAPERKYTGPVTRLSDDSGANVRLTPNHPVLVADQWVVAGEVSDGSACLGATTVQISHHPKDPGLLPVDILAGRATSTFGHDRESGQKFRMLTLDDKPRGKFGGKPSGRGRGDLPAEHPTPLRLLGVGRFVDQADSGHLVQELDDSTVTVHTQDTAPVGVGAALALRSRPADRDGSLTVDEGRDVRFGQIVHATIVPLTGVRSTTEWVMDAPLFNFAVDADESYLAGGFAVHNCRCTMLFQTAERDFDAELDADLADLDAFEAAAGVKGLVGRARQAIGAFGSFDVRFDPNAHPRDHRGRFVDTPDVMFSDGSRGVAVGSNADGTVIVAKPTGAVITVNPDRLSDPPKPKPKRPAAVTHRPLTPLVSPSVAPVDRDFAYRAGFDARAQGLNVDQAESGFVALHGDDFLDVFQDGWADSDPLVSANVAPVLDGPVYQWHGTLHMVPQDVADRGSDAVTAYLRDKESNDMGSLVSPNTAPVDYTVKFEENEGRVYARVGDEIVGMLRWDFLRSDPPEVIDMSVDEAHQRQGIATRMWEVAKANQSDLRHSDVLTPDGGAWVEGLDGPDPNVWSEQDPGPILADVKTGDVVQTWLGPATLTDTGYQLTLNRPEGPSRVEITPALDGGNRAAGTMSIVSPSVAVASVFHPADHPVDFQGKFTEPPLVRLPNGDMGIATGVDGADNVSVIGPDGATQTVHADELVEVSEAGFRTDLLAPNVATADVALEPVDPSRVTGIHDSKGFALYRAPNGYTYLLSFREGRVYATLQRDPENLVVPAPTVGHLVWFYPSGIIRNVAVADPHRRAGLATAMLQFARANSAHPIRHSEDLTDDGSAWSLASPNMAPDAALPQAEVRQVKDVTITTYPEDVNIGTGGRKGQHVDFATTDGAYNKWLVLTADGEYLEPCTRCGGAGELPEYRMINGGICYKCGGVGVQGNLGDEASAVKRINTRAAGARRRAKKRAKEAEARQLEYAAWKNTHADLIVELGKHEDVGVPAWPNGRALASYAADVASGVTLSDEEIAKVHRLLAEQKVADAQRDEFRSNARHVGSIGDKVSVTGTVKIAKAMDTQYGRSLFLIVEGTGDDAGVTVKTFGSGRTLWAANPGDQVTIAGTVKALDEYDNVPQTVLTRTKLEVLDTVEPSVIDQIVLTNEGAAGFTPEVEAEVRAGTPMAFVVSADRSRGTGSNSYIQIRHGVPLADGSVAYSDHFEEWPQRSTKTGQMHDELAAAGRNTGMPYRAYRGQITEKNRVPEAEQGDDIPLVSPRMDDTGGLQGTFGVLMTGIMDAFWALDHVDDSDAPEYEMVMEIPSKIAVPPSKVLGAKNLVSPSAATMANEDAVRVHVMERYAGNPESMLTAIKYNPVVMRINWSDNYNDPGGPGTLTVQFGVNTPTFGYLDSGFARTMDLPASIRDTTIAGDNDQARADAIAAVGKASGMPWEVYKGSERWVEAETSTKLRVNRSRNEQHRTIATTAQGNIPTPEELAQGGLTPDDAVAEWKRLYRNEKARLRREQTKSDADIAKQQTLGLRDGLGGTTEYERRVLYGLDPTVLGDIGQEAPTVLYSLTPDDQSALAAVGKTPGPGYVLPDQRFGTWAQVAQTIPEGDTVPFRNVNIQGHIVGRGWVTNRNGMTYLIQDETAGFGNNTTSPDKFAKAKFNQLETTWRDAGVPEDQWHLIGGIAWTDIAQYANGKPQLSNDGSSGSFSFSPRVTATGGDGTITMWGFPPKTQTLRHEFAHSLDTEPLRDNDLGLDLRRIKQREWRAALWADHPPGVFNVLNDPVETNLDGTHQLLFKAADTPDLSGPSGYGRAAAEEDFAESFAFYGRDRLNGRLGHTGIKGTDGMRFEFRYADLYPNRARYFDELLGLPPAELSPLTKYRIAATTSKLGAVNTWSVTQLMAELRQHGIDPLGMTRDEMLTRLQSLGVNTELDTSLGEWAA